MGLDMYLTKEYYVKNWEHTRPEERHQITILKGGKPSVIPADKISEITVEVITWRKANQIHNWFVKNVQSGVDDCGSYHVSRKDLQNLLDIITEVLNNSELVEGVVTNGETASPETGGQFIPNYEAGKYIKDASVAHKLLPTTSGFFFGSTDYDQWYYDDLVDTKEVLTETLKVDDTGDYKYQSSW